MLCPSKYAVEFTSHDSDGRYLTRLGLCGHEMRGSSEASAILMNHVSVNDMWRLAVPIMDRHEATQQLTQSEEC